MIHGSMRHYASGRKKKYNAWSTKKREYEFKDYTPEQPYRRETPVYKSIDSGIGSTEKKKKKKKKKRRKERKNELHGYVGQRYQYNAQVQCSTHH